MSMIILSFCFFLFVFVGVGVLSVFKAKKTGEDYLLASSSVKPWLAALSAVATNNSGYMFIGQIGFTYAVGLHSIWLMIGWLAGDFATSFFVHKKLRIHTEKQKALSFSGILSNWYGKDYKYLKIAGALITIAFLGTYAAAQLKAGSKALHVLFEWDEATGAIIGAVMVLLYCFAGGIRASIWTDAAQSFVMIIAMGLMLGIGLHEIGGITAFWEGLHTVSPDYMNLFPTDHPFGNTIGPFLFVLGWFFAGVGVIGQPHIMVRFMALDNPDSIKAARTYYYLWFASFYMLTILAALVARLLIPEVSSFDAELALPSLAVQLLPDILVGLVLAGLFSATMSTADSQILSCTAAITHDLGGKKLSGYMAKKFSTVFVTIMALIIALSGNESVFSLVLIAWSALGAAFGPLLIICVLNQKVSEATALAMMCGGVAAVLLWRHFDLNDITFEIGAGFFAGFMIFAIGKVIESLLQTQRKTAKES